MDEKDLSQDEIYVERVPSFVKHRLLEEYSVQFAHIIGFKWNVISIVSIIRGK